MRNEGNKKLVTALQILERPKKKRKKEIEISFDNCLIVTENN